MKRKRIALYGISRIDDDKHRTHAWRVSLRRKGKTHVKNFPDKKYGGKRKALQLAKHYRDKLIIKYPPLTRKEFANILRANNKSGITGVCWYAKPYYLRDGTKCESAYWEASWPTAMGDSEYTTFSVKKYGEDKARRLAINARRRGLKKVQGIFWASQRG